MNKKSLNKTITAVLLSGSLFLGGSNLAFAQDTVDLTLDNTVELALENNRTIKQSVYDTDSARWALSEAKGKKGFSINWQTVAAAASGETYDLQNRDSTYQNVVEASIPLYTGGQLENNIKSKEIGVDISDLTLENTKQQIKYDTTKGYYNILQCRNLVGVNQETVDQLQAHLDTVNAKYAAGTVAKSDVLRSQVELADAKQNLVNAENNYDLSISSLNNLIGLPIDTKINIQDELKYTKYDLSLAECMDLAMTNRPDGVAAAKSIEQAKASVKAGKEVSSGIKVTKNVKILSPDKLYHKTNGGTLVKIGKVFRVDVNSKTMLHAHFPGPFAKKHFPLGVIASGIYGGVRR